MQWKPPKIDIAESLGWGNDTGLKGNQQMYKIWLLYFFSPSGQEDNLSFFHSGWMTSIVYMIKDRNMFWWSGITSSLFSQSLVNNKMIYSGFRFITFSKLARIYKGVHIMDLNVHLLSLDVLLFSFLVF